MSTPFDDIIRDAKQAQQSADAVVIDQVQANEKFAVKLQADQMFSGYRGDGREILPPYTQNTVRIKRARRQPFDRVTLRDTGDFQDGIVIDYGADEFRYDSTDDKRARLTRKYGEPIFGLNDQSLAQLIEVVRPGFIRQMQNTILNA